MKLSLKIILIFSLMMIIAVVALSSYNLRMTLETTSEFTRARYQNMSQSILHSLEQQVSMMELTLEELMDNTSFMSALNQIVRDDSDDHKVGNAARNLVLQQLYRSPMVDNFYRVTFYTRNGDFVSSRFQKDDYLDTSTERAREVISALPWLDAVDATPGQRHILPPHPDFLSVHRETMVYGLVQPVFFHGKSIGYIEVSIEISALAEIMSMVDEDTLQTQAVFDDGVVLYSSMSAPVSYPASMEEGVITEFAAPAQKLRQTVMRTRSDWLGLNLYIAQDQSITASRLASVRFGNSRAAILIMLPTLALIALIASRLTRSMRRLTKKVRLLPVEEVLMNSATVHRVLSETVTDPGDAEVHELEHVFNTMMLRLHDSTLNEMTMREGTLQAQLSALQTQINPHFIYNTLNIISAKSMDSGNLDIIEICDQFAQLLRYSTDTRSRTATMAEEIENVRNYLLLAKARYEENLEFTIDIPADLSAISVPKLTLQPLVENALNHGFDGKNIKRCLLITGQLSDSVLTLEIRDNGTGFSPDVLEKLQGQIREIEAGDASIEQASGHIGLVNTCLRLYFYSQGAMRMSIRNENGAVVQLTMPCVSTPAAHAIPST